MFNQKWTIKNIKQGFERFNSEYGRYPTADEVDIYPHLPSSRQIQRAFGGLLKLREQLGLEIKDYASGAPRSQQNIIINQRGIDGERAVEKELVNLFGHHFVHTEKLIGKGKCRVDFYIYVEGYSFGVDVFYPTSYRNFIGIINIKQLTYSGVGEDLFLVNLNESGEITEQVIANYTARKKNPLPGNIQVMNKLRFIQLVSSFQRLRIS